MSKTPHTIPCPIFYETLAAAAHCTKADAIEHMDIIEDRNHGFAPHAVEKFLDEYAVRA